MPDKKTLFLVRKHQALDTPGKVLSKNRRMSSVWRVVPVLAKMRFAWHRDNPIAADDFAKNPLLGSRQPEFCGKTRDLALQSGGGIGDEDSRRRPVDVENRSRTACRKRNDMGKQRRAVFAAQARSCLRFRLRPARGMRPNARAPAGGG
jgi:hypothetical protein